MKHKNLIFIVVILILVAIILWVTTDMVQPKTIVYNRVVNFKSTTLDDSIGIVEKLSLKYNVIGAQIIPVYENKEYYQYGARSIMVPTIISYKILIVYNGD